MTKNRFDHRYITEILSQGRSKEVNKSECFFYLFLSFLMSFFAFLTVRRNGYSFMTGDVLSAQQLLFNMSAKFGNQQRVQNRGVKANVYQLNQFFKLLFLSIRLNLPLLPFFFSTKARRVA